VRRINQMIKCPANRLVREEVEVTLQDARMAESCGGAALLFGDGGARKLSCELCLSNVCTRSVIVDAAPNSLVCNAHDDANAPNAEIG